MLRSLTQVSQEEGRKEANEDRYQTGVKYRHGSDKGGKSSSPRRVLRTVVSKRGEYCKSRDELRYHDAGNATQEQILSEQRARVQD